MVAASSTLSPRAQHIIKTFQAAFTALDDHKSPQEREHIYSIIARHVTAASPMSFQALPDPVIAALTPEPSVRVDLGDGASYALTLVDEFLRMQFLDVTGDEAMHHFTAEKAKAFAEDFQRVMAAMGGK